MSTTLRFFYEGEPIDLPLDFVQKQHPGGSAVLLPLVGKDIAAAFAAAPHSLDAVQRVEEYLAESNLNLKINLNSDLTLNSDSDFNLNSDLNLNLEQRRAALQERRRVREEALERWRWRSTAIAFSVAAVVAAYVLRPTTA